MSAPRCPFPHLLTILALIALVYVPGCGGAASLEPEQATALVKAEFPESKVEVRTTSVDEEGRGIAVTRFDDNLVSFIFQPTDEGWVLDAVDYDGSLYYIADLQEISTTMAFMVELASALERYKVANGQYPAGDSSEALHVLVPDFMPDETEFGDAWEHEFIYTSDGSDYTLVSPGPDQARGSRDDLILHSGEFVGAGQRQQGRS